MPSYHKEPLGTLSSTIKTAMELMESADEPGITSIVVS
jgi:hypothetical protein